MQRDGTILNARLAAAIVGLGHGQTLVIADAGLPIPPGVDLLDLALVPGVPGFLQTLRAVAAALAVESAVVASECAERNPAVYRAIGALLEGVTLRQVSHAELKQMLPAARLVVRTGECSPYANVVLVGGVTF